MADTPTVETQGRTEAQSSPQSWERSLLRGTRSSDANVVANQRPAGPSAISDPGMAVSVAPLPPGTKSADPNAWPSHPQVAISMRFDFAMPPDEDPLERRHPASVPGD